MSFAIITDSAANLPTEWARETGVEIVPLSYYPVKAPSDIRQTADISAFDGTEYYGAIRKGTLFNTTQVAPQMYIDVFTKWLAAGTDILFLSISSGISGSFASAEAAKRMLAERWPERRITVFDTKGASLGEGLQVMKAADCRKNGMTLRECETVLEETRNQVYQVFTVDSLRHLQRTGRLSGAAAAIGTVLHVKPLLKGDETGKIVQIGKVRGHDRAIRAMAEKYGQLARRTEDEVVGIAHADDPKGAEELKEMILASHPSAEVVVVCYEPVTGSHVGPGALALFFIGETGVRFC